MRVLRLTAETLVFAGLVGGLVLLAIGQIAPAVGVWTVAVFVSLIL